MQSQFPQPQNRFFRAKDFQDQDVIVVFKGWEKDANGDLEGKNGKQGLTWKQRIKYMLRYSYPEFAVDEVGDPIVDENGDQLKNRHYDPEYPKGYAIKYHFDEGVLTSGSLPLFNSFSMCQPLKGDKISISRTGEGVDTEWRVKKVRPASSITESITKEELAPDEDVPF